MLDLTSYPMETDETATMSINASPRVVNIDDLEDDDDTNKTGNTGSDKAIPVDLQEVIRAQTESASSDDASDASDVDALGSASDTSLLVDGPMRNCVYLYGHNDAIGYLKKSKNIDYNYYDKKPLGYATPEFWFKWSLYKHDWWWIPTIPHAGRSVITLVGRSMLHEMGFTEDDLPPPMDDDLEEAQGLPDYPIRLQDLHLANNHSRKTCYWPKMTKRSSHIPILDRSFDAYSLDMLVVHDPDNVTHLCPKSTKGGRNDDDSSAGDDTAKLSGHKPSERPPQDDTRENLLPQRQNDVTIKYIRIDPKVIGIPWVPLPPKEPPPVGHLHLSARKRAGLGNSAAAWDAKLDLPYAIVHNLFHKCYRPSSHAYKEDVKEELEDAYEATDKDQAGNPNEPDHRRNGLPTRFRVIAKIASIGSECHAFVNNEARSYAFIPKSMSEDWSGYISVAPVLFAQPATAVVPIIYGYYVPDVRYGKLSNGQPIAKSDGPRLSPLLLMENCGTQMDIEMKTLHMNYK
ncbi:hypothetical protein FRB90_000324 [Tulasnella sp. 427]|nr:hypothetical protein FRB90_000324 [Tulasnella sp. 427]